MKENKTVNIGPFRVDPRNKTLIEKAADIDRRSVSDFIRLAAIDKAVEVINQDRKRKEEM